MVVVNWDELNDVNNPPEIISPTISSATIYNYNPPNVPIVVSPSIAPTVSSPPIIYNCNPPNVVSSPLLVTKPSQPKNQ